MSPRMCFFVLLIAAGCLGGLAPAARSQPAKGKRHALLVGITDYNSAALSALKYTENDVAGLSKQLRSPRMGFADIRLLTTSAGAKDAKSRPTAANIRAAVRELIRGKGRHDTVLIALAGHGIQLDVKDPDGKGKEKTFAFFCPSDADLQDEVNYRTGDAASLINLNELFLRLAECGAGSKLVLMDACRSERIARNVDVDRVTVPRGVAALFSCGPGQKAFETDKLGRSGHGVFFHFVLEGLKGAAKNSDGEVAWEDLDRYVRRQVTRNVGKVIGGGATQTPHVITNIVGESPVLVSPMEEVKKDDAAVLRKQLDYLTAQIQSKRRELDDLEKRAARPPGNRTFSGLELTGKRAIFLVDMSGSMNLIDDRTPAPQKWEEVRKSVAKLMGSLPALEKFQVITFAEKTAFPLGGEGKWLDHDPKTSPDKVLKALEQIKPTGGTNMYAALESAFRYRADGLDTIYLLSDGLPNHGEGMTEAQKNSSLSETERGLILSRHVRKKLTADWNKPTRGGERVKINTVGFFYESPDLGSFLWALARENDGGFVGMSKP